MQEKLLLVDGLGLLFRSFYAMPSIANAHGQNIGGVHGFIYQILTMLRVKKPEYIVVAFDTGKPTWRHKKSDAYKANRKSSPIELQHQFQWIRDVCTSISVPYLDVPLYEADDIIASYVDKYHTTMSIEVISTDKDLMQLINKNVLLYNPFGKKYTDSDAVLQKWGVRPDQIGEMLALIGDTTDGIKGVSGVGPKTASKWLQEYNNIDNILCNLDFLKPLRLAHMLQREHENLLLARELVKLNRSLDVPCLTQSHVYNIHKIKDFCQDYGIRNVYT